MIGGRRVRRFAKRCAYLAAPLLLAGLLVVAAAGGGVRTSHAARGVMTPAIGAHPNYKFVGDVAANPSLVVFGCQTRTVGNNACYGPDQIQTAYSIKPLYAAGFTGAGRTIVIVDAFQSP